MYKGLYYVEEVEEEDQETGRKWVVRKIHERFTVLLEMILLDNALGEQERQYIDIKLDEMMRLGTSHIVDPLRCEDPATDPLSPHP